MINAQFSYKITLLSMSASADESISDVMSTFLSMESNVNVLRTMNPAAIARMNVTRRMGNISISEEPNSTELYINVLMNQPVSMHSRIGSNWNEYPDSVLETYIGCD
jgi:hypothetical protein